MTMESLIEQLMVVRSAIQSLERFAPTERNCNLILASIQRIDAVKEALLAMDNKEQDVVEK